MIEVCWIQHGGEAPWAQQVTRALKEYDINVKFVTTIGRTQDEYQKNGFESYFMSGIFGNEESVSEEELAKLDEKYGPPVIQSIIDSDVHFALLFKKNENKKRQVVAHAYKFWEQFLDEHPTDYFIVRETASFATRTAYNVARIRGKPLLMRPDIGPADAYFTMCDVGEELCWLELLEAIKDGYKPLNDAQKKQSIDLVATRTKFKEGPAKIRSIVAPRVFPHRYISSWLAERSFRIPTDPIAVAEKRLERKFMRHRTFWLVTRRLFPYNHPVNENFVYLPLYFEDEAMTLANYRYWAKNQLPLIKEVAASLPEGYCLYVKEHPAVPGEQSVSRLRAMQKIPKVKVIDPLVQGQALVRDSKAVIVLQGTAGWEAFLNRKPVVVISAGVFYAYSKLVYKVKDICQLSETLCKALMCGDTIYEKMEDEWLWFINCTLATSSPGTWITFQPPYFSHANLENSQKIADSLAGKMKRMLNKH